MRFAAAVMVVLFHLSAFGLVSPDHQAIGDDRAFPWLRGAGWFGWIGVQVFFVISGFVIAASAENSTARDFLTRRAIRVFPALWICSLVALAVRLAYGEPLGPILSDFGRSVILSPKGPYIDGVVWTLVVEAAFYAFIAFLLIRPFQDLRFIARLHVGATLLGGASAAFLVTYLFARLSGLSLEGVAVAGVLERFPFKLVMLWHGVFFALGMLLWSIQAHGPSRSKWLAAHGLTAFGLLEIVLERKAGMQVDLLKVVPASIWLAAVACIIWSRPLGQRLFPEGQAPWARELGLVTYPLYLGHFTFGMYMVPMLAIWISDRSALLGTIVVMIFGMAWAVVLWPERYLQNRLKHALRRGVNGRKATESRA